MMARLQGAVTDLTEPGDEIASASPAVQGEEAQMPQKPRIRLDLDLMATAGAGLAGAYGVAAMHGVSTDIPIDAQQQLAPVKPNLHIDLDPSEESMGAALLGAQGLIDVTDDMGALHDAGVEEVFASDGRALDGESPMAMTAADRALMLSSDEDEEAESQKVSSPAGKAGLPDATVAGQAVTPKEAMQLLQDVPLLRDVGRTALDRITSTLVELAHYPDGQAIVTQGDVGSSMYVLTGGAARATIDGTEVARCVHAASSQGSQGRWAGRGGAGETN